jgi:hypothetical protein
MGMIVMGCPVTNTLGMEDMGIAVPPCAHVTTAPS